MDFVKSNFGFSYIILEGGAIMYDIKNRLTKLGKSQVWLLMELRKRGVITQPPQLCNIINGIYTYPKAQLVGKTCDEIIKEAEIYATDPITSG